MYYMIATLKYMLYILSIKKQQQQQQRQLKN